MLYCDSPLILVCVVKVNYEEDGPKTEDQFPKGINKATSSYHQTAVSSGATAGTVAVVHRKTEVV